MTFHSFFKVILILNKSYTRTIYIYDLGETNKYVLCEPVSVVYDSRHQAVRHCLGQEHEMEPSINILSGESKHKHHLKLNLDILIKGEVPNLCKHGKTINHAASPCGPCDGYRPYNFALILA